MESNEFVSNLNARAFTEELPDHERQDDEDRSKHEVKPAPAPAAKR